MWDDWKSKAARITAHVRYILSLRIPVYAANASFFLVLAMFPSLVLLLSLLRYTGLEVSHLLHILEGVIPKALLPEAFQFYFRKTGLCLPQFLLGELYSRFLFCDDHGDQPRDQLRTFPRHWFTIHMPSLLFYK